MNIQKIMQEVQRLQKKIKEFDSKEFEFDYKGFVQIKLLGDLTITSMKIKEELVDKDDVETLEDILIQAINTAKQNVEQEKAKLENSVKGMPKGFF